MIRTYNRFDRNDHNHPMNPKWNPHTSGCADAHLLFALMEAYYHVTESERRAAGVIDIYRNHGDVYSRVEEAAYSTHRLRETDYYCTCHDHECAPSYHHKGCNRYDEAPMPL